MSEGNIPKEFRDQSEDRIAFIQSLEMKPVTEEEKLEILRRDNTPEKYVQKNIEELKHMRYYSEKFGFYSPEYLLNTPVSVLEGRKLLFSGYKLCNNVNEIP